MKTITKQSATKSVPHSLKKHILIVIALLFSIPLLVIGTVAFLFFVYFTRFATGSPLASVVIRASEQLTKPAVVDYRTADQYFPEAKLYIPYAVRMPSFTYSFDADSNELTLSTRSSFSSNASQTFTAENMPKVLESTKTLQACQRGMVLAYKPLTYGGEQYKLNQTLKLANGKSITIYINKDCPEFTLGNTVDFVKTITAF